MSKIHRGFTLLELMIVIVILGLLIAAFANFWRGVDRDFIKAQTCANQMSSRLNSIVNGAFMQKGIYHNNQRIYPTQHLVKFYPTGFQYLVSTGSSFELIEKFVTTGDGYGSNECYGRGYRVKIWVDPSGFEAPWKITPTEQIQSKVICDCSSPEERVDYAYKLFYCASKGCKEFHKIKVDFRSYGVVGVPCLQFSWGVDCKKRADSREDDFWGCIACP